MRCSKQSLDACCSVTIGNIYGFATVSLFNSYNCYSTIALGTQVSSWRNEVFALYGMYLIGTVRLTSKKSRTSADFPWGKMPNGTMKTLCRGWMRRATRLIKEIKSVSNGAKELWIQCMMEQPDSILCGHHNT